MRVLGESAGHHVRVFTTAWSEADPAAPPWRTGKVYPISPYFVHGVPAAYAHQVMLGRRALVRADRARCGAFGAGLGAVAGAGAHGGMRSGKGIGAARRMAPKRGDARKDALCILENTASCHASGTMACISETHVGRCTSGQSEPNISLPGSEVRHPRLQVRDVSGVGLQEPVARKLPFGQAREVDGDVGVLLGDFGRIHDPRIAVVRHDKLHLWIRDRRIVHGQRVRVFDVRAGARGVARCG